MQPAFTDSMPEQTVELRRELGLRDLVLFNVAAIVSTRWIAAAAHAGSGSLSLWVLAALFFLVPSAFVVARLSRLSTTGWVLHLDTRSLRRVARVRLRMVLLHKQPLLGT